MSIVDGQRVRALESNAAWASKQNDNTLSGVQTLDNAGSGPQVANTQQKINDLDSDLIQAQTDITNLQGDVSQLQTDVSGLQAIETFVYLGSWDASTNTPTIADGDGANGAGPGGVYRVSVAGTQDLGSGSIAFNEADRVVYNSAGVYEKWDVTDEVTSVNGQQGDVVLALDDLTDVDLTVAPTDGQVLTYENASSSWKAESLPPPVADLNDLTDVNVPAPTSNNSLVWDSTALEWQDKNSFVTGDNSTATAENTYVLSLRNKAAGTTFWDDPFENLTKEFLGKDANGIFLTVEWFDKTSILRKRSVLSGTSPTYNTRTVNWYDTDGITVIRTESYLLSYDVDEDLISEELI